MNRGFAPFGGGFGRPPFRPFPHPFFPRRSLFPFFFFSPFFFPFFREGEEAGEDRNSGVFAQHQAAPGETLAQVAHTYNIPYPVLEEANPHLTSPESLRQGETVVIPRISHMYCHKTYMERDSQPGQAGAVQPGAVQPGAVQPGNWPQMQQLPAQMMPMQQQRAPYHY
ncbi:LysM peptidoglycan-binding domain-containing protein [Paenibacillus kobensis]|uniref:LysM peptidoglycan-binding domain-containing protein n=1 Tax=Paenibacillus kobensis TaxID=59841 RepID=UPI000FDC70B7|nr:LysM domain-containing protein [Paenibacillus kobensis]